MIDEKTPEFSWPLPHAQNLLSTDVGRLREALNQIDQALTTEITDREQHAISTPAHPATAISVTPAGTLAATDVQAALNELNSEKQALLISSTNIKTVNGASLLGSGDVAVQPTTNSLTEIGAALADDDVFALYDTSATAHKKSLMSRVWTYISGKLTGAISGVLTSNLTSSRAVVSDGSGKVSASSVTSTELGYLSGVTGALQTQIDAKSNVTEPSFNNYVTVSGSSANSIYLVLNNTISGGLDWAMASSGGVPAPLGSLVFYQDGPRLVLTSSGNTIINSSTDDASGAKLQVNGAVNLSPGNVYKINNQQIIGARQAAIASAKVDYATGNLDTEAEIITALNTTNGKINSILTALRTHGLIAT